MYSFDYECPFRPSIEGLENAINKICAAFPHLSKRHFIEHILDYCLQTDNCTLYWRDRDSFLYYGGDQRVGRNKFNCYFLIGTL